MKALSVWGADPKICRDVVLSLAHELGRRRFTVAYLQNDEDTDSVLLPPGVRKLLTPNGILWPQKLELEEYLPYLSEDYLLATGFAPFLPRLLCCADQEEAQSCWTKLTVAAVLAENGGPFRAPFFSFAVGLSELTDYIVEKLPSMPPFWQGNPCCEKLCGQKDCPALLAKIMAGEASLVDCALQKKRVSVKINGYELSLVQFGQDIVEHTLRGLLSTLDGYENNCRIEVTLGPAADQKEK